MSVRISVVMLSGRAADITLTTEGCCRELHQMAEQELQARGVLLDVSGKPVNAEATIGEAGLKTGDMLTLQVWPIRIAAQQDSFAAILGHGSVVSWGTSAAPTPCRVGCCDSDRWVHCELGPREGFNRRRQ